jgi:hypothetical protein
MPDMQTVALQMREAQMYKFGDIVINHWASNDNPHKRGVVVRTIRRDGRLNRGKWIQCTNMEGAFWESMPGEKLEVVGSVLKPSEGHKP